jgi:hypothetical protein
MAKVDISDDSYVVTYIGHFSGSYYLTFRLCRLSDDSILVFDQPPIQCHGNSGTDNACVSMNKSGYFVIGYTVTPGLSDWNVAFRRYDSDGLAVGSCEIVTLDDSSKYPDIAIDERNFIGITWQHAGNQNFYFKSYSWDSGLSDIIAMHNTDFDGILPKIDVFKTTGDTLPQAVAWSYDFGGWSQESFSASAYCYQYGISDTIKILFADPAEGYVYEYGTQADDISTEVVLTYQTPYMDFGTFPNYDKWVGYGAIEGSGTGDVNLTWYKNFSDSVYANTFIFSGDTRTQEQLTEDVLGKTISMKITTGSAIDDFLLSGYWWKYRVLTERR